MEPKISVFQFFIKIPKTLNFHVVVVVGGGGGDGGGGIAVIFQHPGNFQVIGFLSSNYCARIHLNRDLSIF